MCRRSVLVFLPVAALACAAEVRIGADSVFVVEGVRSFPIGFTTAPPPDGKTPDGRDGYAELKQFGAVFHRCGAPHGTPLPEALKRIDHMLGRSAETGLSCAFYLPDVTAVEEGNEAELRRIVEKYRRHPGLGYWKGVDEPEWGKVPVEKVQRFYDVVKSLDPAHPVWITQAPRGTLPDLKRYDPAYDVGAIDIYPVGYPPGTHSHLPNKNLSVVGDYANWMREISGPNKPFWMVLQICWSGVTNPDKTLRFPTFPEERYMAYQSIIRGARGLLFFGGNSEPGLNERDRALGWNWTFYQRVLKPVLDELKPGSPLHPALLAPSSPFELKTSGAADVECLVREAGARVFVLAARREGPTAEVKFSGLPSGLKFERTLYEEPRRPKVFDGGFSDWFAPNEVHVYSFTR
ncbi:MAG: hypothetical protein HY822_21615 [Acidobacteria bacterium]|nr:hypothetical protein [Acidobacteriota bacterium]